MGFALLFFQRVYSYIKTRYIKKSFLKTRNTKTQFFEILRSINRSGFTGTQELTAKTPTDTRWTASKQVPSIKTVFCLKKVHLISFISLGNQKRKTTQAINQSHLKTKQTANIVIIIITIIVREA